MILQGFSLMKDKLIFNRVKYSCHHYMPHMSNFIKIFNHFIEN